MARHPVRLAQGVDRVAVEIGDGFAHYLVGRAGIEFHVARHRQRVGASLLQRLADVERLDMGEFVDPFRDQFGELSHEPPALGRGELAPSAAKRALGRVDRRIDIGGPSASDFADLNSARRILDRQALAGLRLDPAPVDEALVGRTRSALRSCELVPASCLKPICLVWDGLCPAPDLFRDLDQAAPA